MSKRNSESKDPRPKTLLVVRAIIVNELGGILLIKRSSHDRYLPGLWEFPGGKLEAGENVIEALQEEVLEEVGLQVQKLSDLVYCESRVLATGLYKGSIYVGLVGLARSAHDSVQLSDEHSDYAWVDVEKVLDYEVTDTVKNALKSVDLDKVSVD